MKTKGHTNHPPTASEPEIISGNPHSLIVSFCVITGLLLPILPSSLEAQFSYMTTNGTVTITGYNGSNSAVVIPDTIDGLPVKAIFERAFEGNAMTSVTVPNSVTSIGWWAFEYCTNLTSVTVPDSVTSVGWLAFGNCTNLKTVTLSDRLTGIASQVFWGCRSLTEITIPEGVTCIEGGAFCYCTSLTRVTFPESLLEIGAYGFADCTSLTNVTLPARLGAISGSAFADCTKLTAFTVDPANGSLATLDGVLFNAGFSTLITYPTGKTGSYAIPNGISQIGDFAFDGCSGLTSIHMPNGLTSIGQWAFNSCSGLTVVTIPDTVLSIGDGAFGDCIRLGSIRIGSNVTTIGSSAFVRVSLTNVTIPDEVTTIGDCAFSSCVSLTNVTIGDKVTSIPGFAFCGCTGLNRVIIPASVTSLGRWAFYGCTSLEGIYFEGNAPYASSPFSDDEYPPGAHVYGGTAYYLPGRNGWGQMLGGTLWGGTLCGGLPTAFWVEMPILVAPPQNQTAEMATSVSFAVGATSPLPLFYQWYFNGTNLLSGSTDVGLALTNVQLTRNGAYTVVMSNVLGALTSAPTLLNVIAPVERRPVPGLKLTGQDAGLLQVDYSDSLFPEPNWRTLNSASLATTAQYCLDLSQPLPAQRFYRAWQTGTPEVVPSLELHLVPAITLSGQAGRSVRLDYINQFGPIDDWATLDTIRLTNGSQLYFDVSAVGQPQRLYRVIDVP